MGFYDDDIEEYESYDELDDSDNYQRNYGDYQFDDPYSSDEDLSELEEPIGEDDIEDDAEIETKQISSAMNDTQLTKLLRDEIKKNETERDFLRFRYRGDICDGVPMAEINPSRFVFKIDNILKGINLGEIKVL